MTAAFYLKRGEALLSAPPAAAIFLKYFLFIIIMHLLCSVKYNYSSEIIYLLYQLYSFANSFLKFFSHIHIFCILRHTSFCGAIHGSSVLCSANLLSGGKYYDTFKMFRTQLLLQQGFPLFQRFHQCSGFRSALCRRYCL